MFLEQKIKKNAKEVPVEEKKEENSLQKPEYEIKELESGSFICFQSEDGKKYFFVL